MWFITKQGKAHSSINTLCVGHLIIDFVSYDFQINKILASRSKFLSHWPTCNCIASIDLLIESLLEEIVNIEKFEFKIFQNEIFTTSPFQQKWISRIWRGKNLFFRQIIILGVSKVFLNQEKWKALYSFSH